MGISAVGYNTPLNVSKKDVTHQPAFTSMEVGTQKEKKGNKALLYAGLAALAATGIYIATRGKAKPKVKFIHEPVKTKLSPEILDQRLAPKIKPGAWSKQDMTKYYTELEAGKDLIKETVTGRFGETIYRYSDESLIAEKTIWDKAKYGAKPGSVELKLKDGQLIALRYEPNKPHARVKMPEWTAWEDGKLDMGIWGVSSMDEALNIFKDALKKNNIDDTQILAAMKQEFI